MEVSRRRLLAITCFGMIFSRPNILAPSCRADDPALPRIRVSADGTRFETADSHRRFIPWGYNYLGKFEHLAEEDWGTPEGWRKIETDFRAMKKLGGNVVRWHLQCATYMESPDRTNAEALDRLKTLLKLAHETGMYLDLTGLSCYRMDRIPAWYDAMSETDRWKSQARFWEAIAATCAGDSAVFCYDLMNEPIINRPGPKDHRWIAGELGGFWFVQRISNPPPNADNTVIAEAWVKTLVQAIRQHDPAAPITVGVIPWAFTWSTAEPLFYAPQVARHLDFVSIHVYPKTAKLDEERAALAKYDIGKPLVVEETFPLNCSLAEFDAFVDAASDRVDGWIGHYFGATPEQHRAGARPQGPIVADFLEYWQKTRARVAAAAGDP